MEDSRFDNLYQDPETLFPISSASKVFEWENDVKLDEERKDSAIGGDWDDLVDSMICDSNSRLIPSGFARSNCTGQYCGAIIMLFRLNIRLFFFF